MIELEMQRTATCTTYTIPEVIRIRTSDEKLAKKMQTILEAHLKRINVQIKRRGYYV